jgi:predicted Rossmann fold nucleotide-binding protein DprA/Smf involved in DNA uptake
MRVGFTGTRDGMADAQRRAFISRVKTAGVTEFHFGCCLGADDDAFDVMTAAGDIGIARPHIVAHPPTARGLLSLTAEMFADETRPPAEYLTRNRAIVDACDVLLACPKGSEELRSGTWATVRYARKRGKPVVIFYPDGTWTEESATPPAAGG